MKKILLSILLLVSVISFAQQIVPVFSLEGGLLFDGLSGQDGHKSSFGANGGIGIDLFGTNKYGTLTTLGVKLKLNYNYYVMQAKDPLNLWAALPPDIVIGETTIPVLLKVRLKSRDFFWTNDTEHHKKGDASNQSIFLFAGPQIGFVSLTGGGKDYSKKNYSIVAGGELNKDGFYLTVYRQTGLTEIYPSQSNVRLNGFTVGFGKILF